MGVDRERILKKVSYIREQVSGLERLLAEKSKEDIIHDPWIIKGLKYTLQTAIEAMIDTAYHISAKEYDYAPSNARDAFNKLAEAGLISRKDLPVYGAMVGFRNRVVHGYQEVSAERVMEIVQNELGDFERFIRQVSVLLK